MLAYVFWHRPAPDVPRAAYEARLGAFHAAIGVPSAWFRVGALPWMPGDEDGYEDWYLVDDFAALGELNVRAVTGSRRAPHDAAAAGAAWGTAGVYALKRGEPRLEEVRFASWHHKPRGRSHEAFEAELRGASVWQRQLVLGPTPEYVALDAVAHEGDPVVAYR